MSNFVRSYCRHVVAHPWMHIIGSLLICMVALAGLPRLGFTNDYRYFFSAQNPYLQAFDEIEKTYSSPDTILFVIQPETGKATQPRTVEMIGQITREAWQIPFSVRVDSLTNFQNTRADGDDLIVGDLVASPETVTPTESDYIERTILKEPILAGRLLALDGRTTAVLVSLRPPRDDAPATNSIIKKAREIRDMARENFPGHKIELTGSQVLSNGFSEAAQRDVQILTPTMFAVIALILMLITRQVFATLAAMLVVGLSAMTALGAAGWFGIPLSPPASGAPTIILTVAVADSIHILINVLVALGKGKSKEDAIVESLDVNASPVFLTSLTTAIGLFSLNFSDAPPYRDLGTIAGFGTIFAWILSMSLFPAVLRLVPLHPTDIIGRQSLLMQKISIYVTQRARFFLIAGLALVVLATAQLSRLHFNDRFVEYFDESIDFRRATDWAAENLTGIYLLNFSIKSGEVGGISDPDYLNYLDNFATWMRQQPEVRHVMTFSDVVKRINRSMNGDQESFYALPADRDLAAQYLLLYEMSLPYGLDLNDQINIDKSATRVIVTLDTIGTLEMKSLRSRTHDWMEANGPTERITDPAGQAVMFSYIGERNFIAMSQGTLYAFLLISFCLFLALRSVRLGLISLLPNIAPPAVAMGLFALFRDEIGLWASFVTATAIGLIVDATVHILSKYKLARTEKNLDVTEAIRFSFTTVGTALWVSSLILMAGFLVLSTSPFFINAMLGLVVSITIVVALVLDFLLLPPLLMYLDKKSTTSS